MSLCSEHRRAKLNDPDWPGRLLHFSSSSTGPGNQNDAAQVVWRRMPMSAGRHFCCGVGWSPSRFSSRQSMHCRLPYYGSLQPVYNFCLQPFKSQEQVRSLTHLASVLLSYTSVLTMLIFWMFWMFSTAFVWPECAISYLCYYLNEMGFCHSF